MASHHRCKNCGGPCGDPEYQEEMAYEMSMIHRDMAMTRQDMEDMHNDMQEAMADIEEGPVEMAHLHRDMAMMRQDIEDMHTDMQEAMADIEDEFGAPGGAPYHPYRHFMAPPPAIQQMAARGPPCLPFPCVQIRRGGMVEGVDQHRDCPRHNHHSPPHMVGLHPMTRPSGQILHGGPKGAPFPTPMASPPGLTASKMLWQDPCLALPCKWNVIGGFILGVHHHPSCPRYDRPCSGPCKWILGPVGEKRSVDHVTGCRHHPANLNYPGPLKFWQNRAMSLENRARQLPQWHSQQRRKQHSWKKNNNQKKHQDSKGKGKAKVEDPKKRLAEEQPGDADVEEELEDQGTESDSDSDTVADEQEEIEAAVRASNINKAAVNKKVAEIKRTEQEQIEAAIRASVDAEADFKKRLAETERREREQVEVAMTASLGYKGQTRGGESLKNAPKVILRNDNNVSKDTKILKKDKHRRVADTADSGEETCHECHAKAKKGTFPKGN